MGRALRSFGAAVAGAAIACVCVAAPAGAWAPEPATFGVGEHSNVAVVMPSDGTVLRADVYFPTDPNTGQPSPGPFPVVMTQTPYGKNAGLGAAGQSSTGAFPYLVQRGYIDVVVDVRGTGDSQGAWGLFDHAKDDGAALVRWAAQLPGSNGSVGLYGASYLGIDQLLTAGAVGPGSPLKAIFPIIAGNDIYRDTAFFGGVTDTEFDAVYLGLTGGLNMADPAIETARADSPDPADTAAVTAQHAGGLLSYHAATVANTQTNGDQAYDEAYWLARNPREVLSQVVANGIPAFLVGGWFDLFQRGEPLNYAGLQNAFAGRPVTAPMLSGQAVTGRYQLLMGPWYHVTAGSGIDMDALQLAWFDKWLKGIETGIADTQTPFHVYELGASRYVDASTYPLSEATPTTLYLGGGPSDGTAPSTNNGTLTAQAPVAGAAADPVVFTGATQPCNRQTEQWSAGGGALAAQSLRRPDEPCALEGRGNQAGPGSLTYTSAPFGQDQVVAGPIDATIYATSTRPETFLEATLDDVGPDGSSMLLTAGGLLGSFRALDADLSWFAGDGRPLLPYHPYTRASATAVPVGAVTRYDVEVFPTFAAIAAGHRLRLTIRTSDSPHVSFTPAQLANLAGGVYGVQRNAAGASFVELGLAPAGAYSTVCGICR